MTEQADIRWMRRAIELAMLGRGAVEPNPMVGCVIVKDGRAIGEGYHERFGGPHAEVNAIQSCQQSTEGATAYVTLEPCCHTGKKTPPCVPALVQARLGHIIIGCLDPNPQVNGQGVAQLRAAGIEVTTGVLEAEARQLIASFIKSIALQRPYVTMKWAETADGKVAGPGGARLQISSGRSSRLVHVLRARSDAILVGINTVLKDDPLLTPRGVQTSRPLLRVVLDPRLRIPLTSRLVATARDVPLLVRCETGPWYDEEARTARLSMRGVEVRPCAPPLTIVSAITDFRRLAAEYCTHLLIEPGPTLAAACFAEGVVDRLWVFRSSQELNDPTAPAAATVPDSFIRAGELKVGADQLTEYLNPASPVFFAAVPSADYCLARPAPAV
jgi:diaminohydroxyphosphoribosylaminopyrimidine deaminase / 5-amino-6-(5-phosphoribosylamino)uracil reductase